MKREKFNVERWVEYDGINSLSCPNCGDEIKVLTNLTDEEIKKLIYQDGDLVACKSKECKDYLYQVACDEGSAWIEEILD